MWWIEFFDDGSGLGFLMVVVVGSGYVWWVGYSCFGEKRDT